MEKSSEIIKATHLNVNMGIDGVRESFKKSIYGTLAFFVEKSVNSLVQNSNIEKIVSPVLDMWGDVIAFSEVYGTHQLCVLKDLLEKRWYKVFSSDAFDMWSQFENNEHLYNVVWVRHQWLQNISVNETHVRQSRKTPAVIFSLVHLLRWSEKDQTIGEKVSAAKQVYHRLVSGILDGVIRDFKIGEEFVFSHLHVHADNPDLWTYFQNHIHQKVPHIMFWDFNIGNLDEFLLSPPFAGKWYKRLLDDEAITYSFAKWVGKLPVFKTPDNVIGNDLLEHISTQTFSSFSDHDGLVTQFKI